MDNHDKDGNGLRYGFLKKRQDVSFQMFKSGSKIVEILQKRCCFVEFLQNISFNHLVRASK